ncbi:unnamed protein product [Onchocerca flexuosa]|uniref:Transposase n=1 Tax=Onchocerca flexuosa TaxID=387005 RepID=A0A183I349_9BILA|nr:unnamed protein product [Onchocerca flexuosa]
MPKIGDNQITFSITDKMTKTAFITRKFEDKKNNLIRDVLRRQDPEIQVRKIGLTTCSSTMPNNSFKRISCDVTTDIIHRGIQQFTQSSAPILSKLPVSAHQLLTEPSTYE